MKFFISLSFSLLIASASIQAFSIPSNKDENDDFVLPEGSTSDGNRYIEAETGDVFKLACPGSSLSSLGGEMAEAICVSGTDFSVDGETFSFSRLGCNSQPKEDTNDLGTACGPNGDGEEIQIGYPTLGGFQETIRVCFNREEARSYYSTHIIYRNIIARDSGNDRPSFKADEYFDFDVDEAYKRDNQEVVIQQLTGISSYIDNGEYFMSRGHLAPNADFVYYHFMDSTFHFINVAPQWQIFNGVHWAQLEQSCRDFVGGIQRDLIVYTGTSGTLELKNTQQTYVEIFLMPEDKILAPPKYYWRVLFDPLENAGVAFVGVNNPYLMEDEVNDFTVCTPLNSHPVMDGVNNPTRLDYGLTYACTVEDLAAVFPEDNQEVVIQQLTGISSYIDNGEYFMSRGHLAPNADFVYYHFMDSTFHFINVAPQWQIFNGVHWAQLEQSCRDFVGGIQRDLIVYTGTSGTLELKNTQQTYVEIFLMPEDKILAPPKYYWRVLFDPLENTGVAFVGVNNPYLMEDEVNDFTVCSPLNSHPVMDGVNNPTRLDYGLTYACTVEDLAAVFPEVPELGNLGLLTE
ncbi:hypothetical protein TCAL_06544 [Tigriopus californicus]|uniref:DNA/RNA non-specific endonuclease/pyrophosphatase/phosphodiesterase domain-containing protein n=1 Tax=Tigriopus californicus TaxID=6832 RepID=A0A553NZJ7_TIGCA|nr:hypothetical protein TCAL_06544 [Tigriopus californicus]